MELRILSDDEYVPLRAGLISAEACFTPRSVSRRRLGGDITVIQSELSRISLTVRQVRDTAMDELIQTALEGGYIGYELTFGGRVILGEGAVMIERIYTSLAGTQLDIVIR